jgi:ATP-dependent Lon protease
MEVLELQGYTEREKLQIARNYLIRGRPRERFGASDISFTTTRSAHHPALHARSRRAEPGARDRHDLPQAGAPHRREPLAWTPVGGDILFIEAARMYGKGKGFQLTGQLGKVMQESMQAAWSWVRSNLDALGVDPKEIEDQDLHVHVPSGAIPKDGPSAGVTVATALASLLTGRRVRRNLAMTGEITLSGAVLPVGGIKEKVLAARRAGIVEILMPAENEADVREDLDAEQLGDVKIHYVKTAEAAVRRALEPKPSGKPGKSSR